MPSSIPGNTPNPFKKNSNTFRSSSDRLTVRKGQTLFRGVPYTWPISNEVKQDSGNVNIGPVFLDNGGFLGAVGGFDIDPYELRHSIATGRAFDQSECVRVESLSGPPTDVSINNPNDTCYNNPGHCAPINTSYNLYEGPFLLRQTNMPQDASACYSQLVQKQYIIDPSNIIPTNTTPTPYLTRVLASNDKFSNLKVNSRICMSNQSQVVTYGGFEFLIGYGAWNSILSLAGSLHAAVPVIPNSMNVTVTNLFSNELVQVDLSQNLTDASSAGFTFKHVLALMAGLNIYDANIIQWASIPFANDGYQFSSLDGTRWTGKNTASDVPTILPGTSLEGAFYNVNIPNADFGNIISWGTMNNVNDMSGTFFGATYFNKNIGFWDISDSVGNMTNMFRDAAAFNQDIGSWNVTDVNNMDFMFWGATAFNQPLNLWNVSNVTTMMAMFRDAAAFNQDLSGWDVTNVTYMQGMFRDAIVFNNKGQPLTWDSKLSNVINMHDMFRGAIVFNQDLSGWDVTDVYNMARMFQGATAFDNLGQALTWDALLSNVTNMQSMFQDTSFNQNISGWDVSSLQLMSDMFNNNPKFNQDLSGWNVHNVTDMCGVFYGAIAFDNSSNSLLWDNSLSKVTTMKNMFRNATIFNRDISGWNTESVNDMSKMFENAQLFDQNIGSWDVSAVTTMEEMFDDAKAFNQDLSGWNVHNVTTMEEMFENALAFNNGGNPLTWDASLSKVTDMESMFKGTPFNQDISGWVLTNLKTLTSMFQDSSFNQDLSGYNGGWDISGGWTITDMFTGSPMDNSYNLTSSRTFAAWFNILNNGVSYLGLSPDNPPTGWPGALFDFSFVFLNDGFFQQLGPAYPTPIVSGQGPVQSWNVSRQLNMGGGFFNNPNDISNISLSLWDTARVQSMSGLFGYSNFNNDSITKWDVGNVTTLAQMFISATAFNQDLSGWNVHNVTDMTNMFQRATAFNNNEQPLTWDASLSNVQIMYGMFHDAIVFNQDISGWDVTNVTNMAAMFQGATTFDNLGQALTWDASLSNVQFMNNMFQDTSFNQNISGWDVSSVTKMNSMFNNNPKFNQDLSGWNTGSVTDMSKMFENAHLFDQNIGSWDVGTVTTMEEMFDDAKVFNQDLSGWNVHNVTTMKEMFEGASAFNKNLNGWNVANVTTMEAMFHGALAFDQPIGIWDVGNVQSMNAMFTYSDFNQDISGWNVSSVTDMAGMFNTTPFNQDIGEWNVSSVLDMRDMFNNATIFNQDISGWNVNNVTNMTSMFNSATAFSQDLGNWDISNVTTMNSMFNGSPMDNTYNINSSRTFAGWFNTLNNGSSGNYNDISNVTPTGWPGNLFDFSYVFIGSGSVLATAGQTYPDTSGVYGPVGSWNVSKLTNMDSGFRSNPTFNEDISLWDTAAVTNMGAMFQSATSFNKDISEWNVSNVTNLGWMFNTATAFTQDLSWNISSATDTGAMFQSAINFNGNINNWKPVNVTNMGWMFNGATAFNQDISGWFSSTDVSYAMAGGGGATLSNMFKNTTSFNQDLSPWIITGANISGMFSTASGLSSSNKTAMQAAWGPGTTNNFSNFDLSAAGL